MSHAVGLPALSSLENWHESALQTVICTTLGNEPSFLIVSSNIPNLCNIQALKNISFLAVNVWGS